MNTLFKGCTAACLKHLAHAIEVDYLEKRKVIADFVGVSDGTARRWFRGLMLPVGEPLIRLRFYLEFLGYRVDEIELLNKPIRDAARLFAFGVASLTEVMGLVGFSEDRNGASQLLAVFRGTRGISTRKLRDFESFVELYGERLAEKQRAIHKVVQTDSRHNNDHLQSPTTEVTPPIISRLPRIKRGKTPREALIESLAGSIVALIPLAQSISSDEFTAEERAQVRELSGSNGVFTLANLLYRLCGERTRTMHSSIQHPASSKGLEK